MTDYAGKTHNEIEHERIRWEAITLYEFVIEFWEVIEPGKLFVDGRHIWAICLHLEAVYKGLITRLIVNMPPRHAKSSIISVLFRAWCWVKDPSIRFLCSSYALSLATRDNVKVRRLILSSKFQQHYGHLFKLTKDQNAKIKFENDKRGSSLAVSVGSAATGEGFDIGVCLCYNAEVTTNIGRIRIGDIVEKRLPVRILAFDHVSNTVRWRKIEKYEKNFGRPCVRVTFNDGRVIDATTDHLFYVVGRGYVPAAQLINTDKVITDESLLRSMRERNGYLSIPDVTSQTSLLQQSMSLCQNEQNNNTSWTKQNSNFHLRSMRKDFRSLCQPRRTSQDSNRMFSYLSWCLAEGRKQSILQRENRTYLQNVRQNVFYFSFRRTQEKSRLLFSQMQKQGDARNQQSWLSGYTRPLCFLRSGNQDYRAKKRKAKLLLSQMCQSCSSRVYCRRKQSQICRWKIERTILCRISQSCTSGTRTRWTQMQVMPNDQRRERQRVGCASYRLRQGSQRDVQSCKSLPILSREDAWQWRAEIPVETLLVRCVESIPTHEYVYNLHIAVDHNYFVNGVLVHNCDDPHSIDETRSDITREGTLEWFKDVWCTRLNDPKKSAMIVVGQRVHKQDLSGYILSGETGEHWVHLNLATEFKFEKRCITYYPDGSELWRDERKKEGELLWPERFPKEVIERAKRRHGPMAFAALYQQEPVPAGGNIFKIANERLFTIDREAGLYLLETPRGIKPVPISECWHATTSDVAAKEKEQNDYTVFATWAITPMLDVLLIDVKRGHWTIPEQKQQGYKVYLEFNNDTYQCVYFEDVGYQSAIGQELIMMGVPCLPFSPKGDKVLRAGPASIWQQLGKMYFLKFAIWLAELQSELYDFPKDAHDDQVDCISMAVSIVRKPAPLADGRKDEEDIPASAENTGGLIPLSMPIKEPIEVQPLQITKVESIDPFAWADQHLGGSW